MQGSFILLAALAAADPVEAALRLAVRAAAISVTRPAAADSIPARAGVLAQPSTGAG